MCPLVGWTLTVYAPSTHLPQMGTDTLLTPLFPMLGIGAYQTIEKAKGVAKYQCGLRDGKRVVLQVSSEFLF